MKRTTILLSTLVFATQLSAQNVSSAQLNFNNVQTQISNNGLFFNDPVNDVPFYEVPKNSGNQLIGSAAFWFGGYIEDNSLGLALKRYGNSSNDFFSGPYGNTYDSSYEDKIWSINLEELSNYQVWWEACEGPNANTTDCQAIPVNEIPSLSFLETIDTWPAHGDVSNGEGFYLAPFVDTDGNGMYSPDMGDIPQMKGNSMAYMIVNDDRMNHSVSGANKLGIEAHYMVYQLDGSEELENTTFIDLTLYNRTNSAIYDFVTSFWTEVFLGNLFDNYVGSNPSKNLVYAYNGSNTDEFGYGENPPAFGIMSLCEPISSALSYPESGTINGVWNSMNGLNLDGSNLLDNNGQATKFQYSGNPSVSGSYSEMQLSNEPGYKKTILSFEMGIFEPSFDDVLGMTIPKKISLAVIYSRTGDHLENVNSLFETADLIQEYYDQHLSSCFINSAEINQLTSENSVSLFPNPTNQQLTIVTESQEIVQGKIISITGKEVHLFSTTGKSTNIDCSHLENGMYILQLNDGSKIISKQFVKVD